MTRAVFMAVALTVASVCSGQSLPPVTVDPAVAGHTMVQAAGMPLSDGALPPGMLTVRVVRGAFTADVAGEVVTVEIPGGKNETGRTGPDGRAQFAHLPVGSRVRVTAVVQGQVLTSDTFALPAESGVRVLLVVDDDGAQAAAAPAGDVARPGSPLMTFRETEQPVSPAPARRGPSAGVLAVRVFFTIATIAGFAWVLFGQSTPRRRRGDRNVT